MERSPVIPSGLSRKFDEEFSLESGRQTVARGESRGSREPTRNPVPSPAQRERVAESGMRAI